MTVDNLIVFLLGAMAGFTAGVITIVKLALKNSNKGEKRDDD